MELFPIQAHLSLMKMMIKYPSQTPMSKESGHLRIRTPCRKLEIQKSCRLEAQEACASRERRQLGTPYPLTKICQPIWTTIFKHRLPKRIPVKKKKLRWSISSESSRWKLGLLTSATKTNKIVRGNM